MIWLKNCSLGIKLQSLNLCMERHLWIKISFVSKHSKIQFLFEKMFCYIFLVHQSHMLKSAFPIICHPWTLYNLLKSAFPIIRHPWTLYNLVIFLRTTGSNWTTFGCDTHWMVLFQNLVWWPCLTSNMLPWLLICWQINIFYFKTIWWNEIKFNPNSLGGSLQYFYPLTPVKYPRYQILVFHKYFQFWNYI